uniref:EamA domain-containing protein n=1 Tax=Helicotheca tamesis TaxID=374047 RepID=A0A7S2HGD9_9STRA|mmetsp:Transcript_1761/g.2559  ORF Transcript_1761/g.2559 Transcript_1761/m.2559 type:complete len:167 (+) Transcript_1761:173-673(+)
MVSFGWHEWMSFVLVGAVWGCTNPFLRKGSADDDDPNTQQSNAEGCREDDQIKQKMKGNEQQSIINSLLRLTRVGVFLPYLLNQCGSLLYYHLLANSDLTLSVPISNALALLFSALTSFFLGERLDKPLRATLGATFVLVGVGICLLSSERLHLADEPDKLQSDEL